MSEIGFIQKDTMEVPESFADVEQDKMRSDAIKKIERKQVDKQVRNEAGLTDIPTASESVPKELPKMLFQLGAKLINCEKFELTPEEATSMAKHISIVVGPISSRVYSVVVITLVTISKISDCYVSIKNKLGFGQNKDYDKDPRFMD